MVAAVENAIVSGEAAKAEAARLAEAAGERLTKIEQGEEVQGGLDKPMTREDILAILRALGITQKQLRRAQWLASLTRVISKRRCKRSEAAKLTTNVATLSNA